MKDTNQVREIEQQGADIERIADLYSRIAKGYSTTPEVYFLLLFILFYYFILFYIILFIIYYLIII